MGGQVPKWFAHFDWSGGAVESDDVDLHGVHGRERGTDLGSGQHATGQLDGHLELDGHDDASGQHGASGAVDGALGTQKVKHRLDHQEIDAAL